MAYTIKGEPWRIQDSKDVSDCKTSQEVMEKAGLNYEVGCADLYAGIPINEDNPKQLIPKNVNGFRATYRKDTNKPFAVVKSRYEVVQNTKAFEFFDKAIDGKNVIFDYAGNINGGQTVFVAVKLSDQILVKGDPCDNYLLFTNDHGGKSSVTIMLTPIRLWCMNQLSAALKASESYVRFRHTSNINSKIMEADRILGITKKQIELTNTLYNQLANIKVTDDEVKTYIANHFLSVDEKEQLNAMASVGTKSVFNPSYRDIVEDAGVSTNKLNKINATYEYYHIGPGQDKIQGNAWGMYNAITGYYCNIDNSVDEKRMASLVYGDKVNKINHALVEANYY